MSLADFSNETRKPSIVFIDDSKLWQTVLFGLLDSISDFEAFDSWSQAFSTLTCKDIDILILDVQMPGMDGPDIANMLRAYPNIKKIVLFSSLKEQELKLKAAQCGADESLTKSLPRSTILVRLKKLLDSIEAQVLPPLKIQLRN